MSSSNKDTNITVPLSDLIEIILGDYYGSTSGVPSSLIPIKTALILENLLKDSQAYKVVWADDIPSLWHMRAWMEDSERRQKQKDYAEAERIKGWIKKANHKLIIKAVLERCKGLPEDNASAIAMRLLNGMPATMQVLRDFWGINKLIEKVEEL